MRGEWVEKNISAWLWVYKVIFFCFPFAGINHGLHIKSVGLPVSWWGSRRQPMSALSTPLPLSSGRNTWRGKRSGRDRAAHHLPSSLSLSLHPRLPCLPAHVCRYWSRAQSRVPTHDLNQERWCGWSRWPLCSTAPRPTMWTWRNWTGWPKRGWRYSNTGVFMTPRFMPGKYAELCLHRGWAEATRTLTESDGVLCLKFSVLGACVRDSSSWEALTELKWTGWISMPLTVQDPLKHTGCVGNRPYVFY